MNTQHVSILQKKHYQLVKTIDSTVNRTATADMIIWDGKNEDGESLFNVVYIYVYESPKERGIGKFTCITGKNRFK